MEEPKKEDEKDIKSKLTCLLNEIDKEYRQWYRKNTRRSFWLWFILQIIAITPGFVVSIVVALSDKDQLIINKPWIVILTALGSLVGFILVQFKVYDIWKIRADGELAFDNLYRIAKGKIAISQTLTPEECLKIYEELCSLINEIESDAVKRYFSLSTSDFVATFKNK